MVCHAEDSRLVGCSAVCDVDGIIVSELVSDYCCNCARESHMAVRINHCKLEGLRICLLGLINLVLPAFCTAVEAVLAVVLIENDLLAVKFESTACDTVCITSDRSTEVACLGHVVIDVVETEDHVHHVSVLVRNHH